MQHWIKAKILVGVSGGPDSVALSRVIHAAKVQSGQSVDDLHVVHVNHQTRPSSDADERFVAELADELGVGLHIVRRDTTTAENESASEECLRDFRYAAMLDTAKRLGIRFLATGHTADDQIETLLFRLARGTGLYGLTGIPFVRVQDSVSIVRPLLQFRKRELLQVLSELNQTYCRDESNEESDYTRNFLRNEIVPALSDKFGGQFDQSLQRIASQAAQHIELLDELADPLIRKQDGSFEVEQLAAAHPVVAIHALRKIWRGAGFDEGAMTAEKWKHFYLFIAERSASHIQLPGNVTAKLDDSGLKFETTASKR